LKDLNERDDRSYGNLGISLMTILYYLYYLVLSLLRAKKGMSQNGCQKIFHEQGFEGAYGISEINLVYRIDMLVICPIDRGANKH
jgi:hypothetical protein